MNCFHSAPHKVLLTTKNIFISMRTQKVMKVIYKMRQVNPRHFPIWNLKMVKTTRSSVIEMS